MIDGKATLSALRNLRKYLRLRGVVLIAIDDDGHYGVVSWGRTRCDCKELSRTCDAVADRIEQGKIAIPFWRTNGQEQTLRCSYCGHPKNSNACQGGHP